jgi:16S rRNA (adenine1518-N6/adenine1519-N6)-dimethyltransferase
LTGKDDFPTLNDLKEVLKGYSFQPSKARGQNFLFDHNTLRHIVDKFSPNRQDTVLEIGPGSGFLTMHLAQAAGRVLAVEIDKILVRVAKHFLESSENVEIVNADILQNDNLSPRVVERVQDLGGCNLIVGNLPYSAATAIISAIARSNLKPRHLVFLLQEEVARRLAAGFGSPDYCASSVITAAVYDMELLGQIGPSVFWPRPKVNSRLMLLTPSPKVGNYTSFAAFVHTLFARPRKTAVNSYLEGISRQLQAAKGYKSSLRDTVTSAIQSLGMDPKVRPSKLDFDQIHDLFKKLVPETLR